MNAQTRDMSKSEYERKLKAYGFEPVGFLGYWSQDGISISELNAGPRRRDQLAHIIKTYARMQGERANKPWNKVSA